MHLVLLAEAPEGIIPRFEKWLRERIFITKDGRGYSVRLREFKLYDLVYPKEIHEQVVGSLKNIEYSGHLSIDKFKRMLKLMKKIIPECIEIIDTDKIKTIPIEKELINHGITAKVWMLGIKEDEMINEREML